MIVVRLQAECYATNWNCCICDGATDKRCVYAVAFRDTGEELGHVCEECIEAGPGALRQRAIEKVESLRAAAVQVAAKAEAQRQLADELAGSIVPSMADWKDAEKLFDKFYVGEAKEMPLPTVHTPLNVNGKSVPVILQK